MGWHGAHIHAAAPVDAALRRTALPSGGRSSISFSWRRSLIFLVSSFCGTCLLLYPRRLPGYPRNFVSSRSTLRVILVSHLLPAIA